jgi:disulfide bond formation protein DsbB
MGHVITFRAWIALAALGSAGLLAGAFAFQYLGGMAPCSLCITQRWPHAIAVVIGSIAVVFGGALARLLAVGGAVAAAVTAGYGAYHTGVERGWFAGPDTCTGGSVAGISADDLLDQIMAAPLVKCDEVAWQMLGLSMASWNAVLSCGLVALWLMALRARD